MPKFTCIKHDQVMVEKLVNNKIQPYCMECIKVQSFDEELMKYKRNEEWNKNQHRRELKLEYFRNIFNAFSVFLKFLLILLFPAYIVGSILCLFIAYSTVIDLYAGLAFLIISFLLLKTLFTVPKHQTQYSEPTIDEISKMVDLEKERNLEKVKKFKDSLKKEYLIRSTRIEEVDLMDGYRFEVFIADLIKKIGFQNIKVTRKSGDGGVDILAENLQGEKTAIQCKRLKSKVGNTAIQEIYLGKKLHKCKKAMVITNSYYTKPAIQAAVLSGVELWDRIKLTELMREIEPKFTWEEYLHSYYTSPKEEQNIS
ncbi:restriction endonuclease [Metabacillus sp. GX 13764]|uniref:restriction endonuclease n=1 Tax=Metabacillus kandeliae TaxID=2900151 RepID=UPI001E481E63|nr:restriction endonuclease [Metabacillus kandeliae]MCD7032869.1 restriction endonuclease [Metabacillus kandeliae]